MSVPTVQVLAGLLTLLLSLLSAVNVDCFAVSSPPTPRVVKKSAKNAEEDLEMTRQIILQHVRNTGGDDSDYLEVPSASPTGGSPLVPFNDLMIRAALGQDVERTPIWLFRQAGRHLPEYNEYKRSTGKNFLELLQDPSCVAECTLQPVRRYPVDAAILFSDILVIPEALGIEVTMPGGVGIQVPHPLMQRSDVSSLPPVQSLNRDFVESKLGHVLEAVRQIRSQLSAENIPVPLIGFSAAPWTLLYYMVGGSSKKNTEKGVWWLETYPVASQQLLDKLTAVVIEYLSAQVDNGCQLLQIFEAMGMMIDDKNFVKYALPCLETIGRELKSRHPTVPLMVFCRGACHLNSHVADLGCFDVITIDGTVDRTTARASVVPSVSLQGNYDPAELIPENGKTVDSVQATAKQMLQELGPQRLIANLGEGLGGKESPELVSAFVTAIHEESAKMIQQAKGGTTKPAEVSC
jgi:uroporphyrinogen decarboxylase